MPWNQTPRQAFCDLLNQWLAREPAIFDLLAPHAGQTFSLVANPVKAALTIAHDGRLSLADPAVIPDVSLTIDTQALWAAGWRPGEPLPERPGMIQVSGDVTLAQTLSTLAASWRPDPEDLLSQAVGDVAAVQMVSGIKRVGALATQFVTRTSQNLAEYAAHEARLLASQASSRVLADDLTRLHQTLDASSSKLDALFARLSDCEAAASGGRS